MRPWKNSRVQAARRLGGPQHGWALAELASSRTERGLARPPATVHGGCAAVSRIRHLYLALDALGTIPPSRPSVFWKREVRGRRLSPLVALVAGPLARAPLAGRRRPQPCRTAWARSTLPGARPCRLPSTTPRARSRPRPTSSTQPKIQASWPAAGPSDDARTPDSTNGRPPGTFLTFSRFQVRSSRF